MPEFPLVQLVRVERYDGAVTAAREPERCVASEAVQGSIREPRSE